MELPYLGRMDYTTKIKNPIRTVEKSETFHAVLIEGPAGYDKSTAVSEAFTDLNIEPVHLGMPMVAARPPSRM